MSGNSTTVRLGDFVEILTGFPFKSSKYIKMPPGIRVVRGDNVKEGFFEWGNKTRYWDDMSEALEKYLLNARDIIIGMDGSRVGYNRARVGDDDLPLILAQRVACLRSNENVDQNFLYYVILDEDFKGYIRRIQTGTSIPHISSRQIADYKFRLPRIQEQRAIAHILGTLDDKIELNRKMNATLEAMAQAIFKSWFVDFDPVRAKMEGREPAGMDAETAALFPDEFEVVNGQEIPKGWKVSTIGSVLELAYGKALKEADRRPGQIPVYGSHGLVGWHDEPLVKGPGIIVGRKGNPGNVSWSQTDFYPIDTTFYVVPKAKTMGLPYLYHELMFQDLPSQGSDSAVPGLNRNIAYMNSIVIPSNEILKRFDAAVMPLFKLIHLNIEQSRTLAAIRDTLLPKLISGEIRVPDAMLEAAET